MRVFLCQNLQTKETLLKESRGTIIGFQEREPGLESLQKAGGTGDDHSPPVPCQSSHKLAQKQAFATMNAHKPWPVVKFDHGQTKPIYADCAVVERGVDEPDDGIHCRTQIPLIAGYAYTTHQVQV